MNRSFFITALSAVLLTATSTLAQTSTWTIDTNHTQVNFQIRRVPVSNVPWLLQPYHWNRELERKGPLEI